MVGKCIHFIDRDKRKTKKQKNKQQKMQKYAEFLMTHFFKKNQLITYSRVSCILAPTLTLILEA